MEQAKKDKQITMLASEAMFLIDSIMKGRCEGDFDTVFNHWIECDCQNCWNNLISLYTIIANIGEQVKTGPIDAKTDSTVKNMVCDYIIKMAKVMYNEN